MQRAGAVRDMLYERIQTTTAHLVVIGLGYVGLPVAARFAQVGFQYRHIDLAQLKAWLAHPGLVDGRRVFEREVVEAAGFVFRGIGIG
jgi:3-hydroxyisobutyrate dehydrogenase-like beta-hydroxyacid dehydrogenase